MRGNGLETENAAGYRTNYRSRVQVSPAPTKARQENSTKWDGEIVRKVYPQVGKDERPDGFTIALAKHSETGEIIKIQGAFGPVIEGDIVPITEGKWADDLNNQWGETEFMWVNATAVGVPQNPESIQRYLQNLDGIGPVMAKTIVDTLGVNCLEQIDNDPSVLKQIKTRGGKGISDEDLEEIIKKWPSLAADRVNMLFLDKIGITGGRAKRVCDHYKTNIVDMLTHDPYKMTEVEGIGFRLADMAAAKLGFKSNDPRRLRAGVEYVLAESESDGHVCLTREEMNKRAMEMLFRRGAPRPKKETVMDAIQDAIDDGKLWSVIDETDNVERIYTTEMFVIETRLYEGLENLLTAAPIQKPESIEKPEDSPLTDEQWQAIQNALSYKISILTGGPGTGKTFTVNTILDELDKNKQSYVCVAPTGKAAKRMEESTGRKAQTIHRALKGAASSSPKGPGTQANMSLVFDEAVIQNDIIVMDESSMTDMRIMERVISHMGENTRIILVGDPNQLPAVGAGSVLHDLLDSERVPTAQLTKVQRQAAGSLNVLNLNRIKEGKEPFWNAEQAESHLREQAIKEGNPLPEDFSVRSDWYFVEATDEEQAKRKTLKLIERIEDKFGASKEDILVTSPMRKGGAGVNALNSLLQADQNPSGTVIRDGDYPLRTNDRVMNIKNRYGKEKKDENGNMVRTADVMNGELGKIVDFNEKTKSVQVDFGFDELVNYTRDELSSLVPAYAATTHKLQGSEASAVIAPLLDPEMRMASRQLLYTAWSRSKELCCVVGKKQAVLKAIKRDGSQRNSRLDLMVSRVGPRIKARWEILELKQKEAEARRKRQSGGGVFKKAPVMKKV